MQVYPRRVGRVFLVGAGPGDPELITVKGLQALQKADVVVYDRLSPIELLEHVPYGAQRIYVGKKGGHYAFPQDQINLLLRDKALQGLVVVRLKGGDPFLFGRGGEELLYLKNQEIPVEVIPGVTSALAVPASVGIPVTHRSLSSSITIVSGHQAIDAPNSIDWRKLGNATETLIVLMPLRHLEGIVSGIIHSGRSMDTPAAIIQAGTRSDQRTVRASLKDLLNEVKRAGIRSPALLIVGEVVRVGEQLFELAQTLEETHQFNCSGKYSSMSSS